MTTVAINWGKGKMDLELPAEWKVIGIMQPNPLKAALNSKLEIQKSLAKPIGCKKLAEIAKGKKKIALVIDDISRPTPVGLVAPAVMAELKKAGIKPQQVTVIPAIGLHRPMPVEEVEARTKVKGLKVVNPDCDDEGKMINLGTTSRGSPVWVCSEVANADLVISIGCIEPHIIASFGGGYKNLFPGAAGRATTAHNHSLNSSPHTFNMVGQPIDKNPMRQDLEEAGKMIKAPVFIINTVLNSKLEVVRAVCGDPVQAHRAGVEVSAQIYGVKVPGAADVVITSSHPMDSDLRQGVKALANTIRSVKKGGVLITLVKADEGVGVFGLANKKLPLSKGALKFLAPVLLPLIPKLKIKGLGEEDKFFLYFAIKAMTLSTMLMYAPTIPEKVKANLPFVDFVDSPQQAIEMAKQKVGNKADVLLFPHGGSTFPILG
jgi:nickel-dependent lactate racemase